MRNNWKFYLMLPLVCFCVFILNPHNFCFAQSSKSEKLDDSFGLLRKTPVEQAESDDVIRVETNLIVADILVFDKKGNPVKDLKMDDFVVKEDGERQEICTFSFGASETIPRSIVLIIDYSGSQLPYIKSSIEAAKLLVDKLNPQDRMAIVTDDVELMQDFTTDKTALKEKLNSLKTKALSGTLGQSKQYSALMAVLSEMFAEKDFRPIIIFQTDGDELTGLKGEQISNLIPKERRVDFGFEDVLRASERARATVYSIIPGVRFFGIPENEYLERAKTATLNDETAFYGLRDKVFDPRKLKLPDHFLRSRASFYNRQQSALNQIARITGGSTNYLEQPDQAEKVYSDILSEMNVRYLIGYYPSNQSRDGRKRSVSIELRENRGYKIWGRKAYVLEEK